MAYYYSPFQKELQERLGGPFEPRKYKATLLPRAFRIAPVITTAATVGAYAVAYTPFVQPGSPARQPDTFQIYNLGGMVV